MLQYFYFSFHSYCSVCQFVFMSCCVILHELSWNKKNQKQVLKDIFASVPVFYPPDCTGFREVWETAMSCCCYCQWRQRLQYSDLTTSQHWPARPSSSSVLQKLKTKPGAAKQFTILLALAIWLLRHISLYQDLSVVCLSVTIVYRADRDAIWQIFLRASRFFLRTMHAEIDKSNLAPYRAKLLIVHEWCRN